MTTPSNSSYREIALPNGMVTQVSPQRYDDLKRWKWHCVKDPRSGNWYVVRCGRKKEGEIPRKRIYMHRQILGLGHYCDDRRTGDHANPAETLNNQDYNLRIATDFDQQHNKRRPRNNSTGFKNVVYEPARKAYKATLQTNRKRKNLGRRKTAEEAFALVCAATLEQHGEFARTA